MFLLSHFSCVQLFEAPWTTDRQASPSTGFPSQGYWSGLPFLPPGDLPSPGIKPGSPAWQVDSLPLSHLGSPGLMTQGYILLTIRKKQERELTVAQIMNSLLANSD